MAPRAEVPRDSNSSGLYCQTGLKGGSDAKKLSGALSNHRQVPDEPVAVDPKVEPKQLQLHPRQLRRQSNAQDLAPGYLWNGTTQELIPILPEDHPDYRQNQEVITEAIRRWDQGASK